MKKEFIPSRRLKLARGAFLGISVVVVGIVAVFGYLAGVTILEGWGGLDEPVLAADAQYVGALALVEGVLMVLLIVLTVVFSRTRRPDARTINWTLRDEISGRRRAKEARVLASVQKVAQEAGVR